MLTKQNARRAAWLVGIAAIALVLCSKSSPLYTLNDWMDANIFFTMGKSMFSGRVLYRDGEWPTVDVERAQREVDAATERIVKML